MSTVPPPFAIFVMASVRSAVRCAHALHRASADAPAAKRRPQVAVVLAVVAVVHRHFRLNPQRRRAQQHQDFAPPILGKSANLGLPRTSATSPYTSSDWAMVPFDRAIATARRGNPLGFKAAETTVFASMTWTLMAIIFDRSALP